MYVIWTKIKHYISPSKILAVTGLGLLIALSFAHPLGAQNITQGYTSDVQLQRGMVVVVKKDDPSKIEPAKADNIEKIHGIVVNSNDAAFTVSGEGQNNFVATIGRYEVLVSDQNGPIVSGDYLSISSIEGIAMKAGRNHQVVVGKALYDFDGTANIVGNTQLKDTEGNTQDVKIGRIFTDVGIARNPLLKPADTNVPEFLRKASEGIANKPVSAVRVYISLVLLVITSLIAGSMMFSGIRSAVISIGRNPLSKKSIVRGLIQIVVTSLIVFIMGVFGVYLLIRL